MTRDQQASTVPDYVPGHGLLDERVVVVTAAAGAGIGSAVARRCLEEGAKAVVLGDIHERRLGELTEKLRAEFGDDRVASVQCDVTVQEQVDALLDAADAFGGIDVMINNAAQAGSVPILDMSDEHWSRVLDVTLTGTFRCVRGAAKRMVDRGVAGVIVNNSSVVAWRPEPSMSHYAAAKGGVNALTRCAAGEFSQYGIRVNAVSPSLAMHPFLRNVTPPETLVELEEKEMFGRAAEPWEVANVIVFLASGYSSYMTGEIVSVSSQHP
jgi:3-oxoacyl-[acyl-carrier protein] reductase